ncbi:MAG: hypothetical protein ACRD3I_14090, partial [Terriglobales bacterium]
QAELIRRSSMPTVAAVRHHHVVARGAERSRQPLFRHRPPAPLAADDNQRARPKLAPRGDTIS